MSGLDCGVVSRSGIGMDKAVVKPTFSKTMESFRQNRNFDRDVRFASGFS